jgi:hypothetical protein
MLYCTPYNKYFNFIKKSITLFALTFNHLTLKRQVSTSNMQSIFEVKVYDIQLSLMPAGIKSGE